MSTSTETVYLGSGESAAQLVLTRSFDGKPTATRYAGRDEHVILVGNPEKHDLIGFPSGEVFQFDADLLGMLERAYRDGNEAKMQSLWKRAIPFNAELDT